MSDDLNDFWKSRAEKWKNESEKKDDSDVKTQTPVENKPQSQSIESVEEANDNNLSDYELALQLQEEEYKTNNRVSPPNPIEEPPLPQITEQLLPSSPSSQPYRFHDHQNRNVLYNKYNFSSSLTIRIIISKAFEKKLKVDPVDFTMKKLGNYVKKQARWEGVKERSWMFEKDSVPKYPFCFWDPILKKTYECNLEGNLQDVFGAVQKVHLRIIPKDQSIRLSEFCGSFEDSRNLDMLLVKTKLRGSKREEVESFREKERKREDEKRRKEREEEKQRLRRVRQQLKEDREKGKRRNWSKGKNSRWDPENTPAPTSHMGEQDPYMYGANADPSRRKRIKTMDDVERKRKKKRKIAPGGNKGKQPWK